jgi:sortase (surface protein transpeptidase)
MARAKFDFDQKILEWYFDVPAENTTERPERRNLRLGFGYGTGNLLSGRRYYYGAVIIIYALTVLLGIYAFKPALFKQNAVAAPLKNQPAMPKATAPAVHITSGVPVRIVVASLNVDLPVDRGVYNPADNSWSLSDVNAQFAMPSYIANDYTGNTLIYGHDTPAVFGIMSYIQPGAQALVYTDNGHVFSYIFQSSKNITPDDVSIFKYSGPPQLTVQTCSGDISQWRQMFNFKFDKVER